MKNYINCTKFVNIAGRKMAYNVRVLGDVRDKNRLNFRLITKHNKND